MTAVRCAMLLVAVSGCGVTIRSVIPAPSGFTAQRKPSSCHIDFFWLAPDRPYQELAAISLGVNGTADYNDYQAFLRAKACELGGDAVVVLHPFTASEGIVVKYSDGPNLQP